MVHPEYKAHPSIARAQIDDRRTGAGREAIQKEPKLGVRSKKDPRRSADPKLLALGPGTDGELGLDLRGPEAEPRIYRFGVRLSLGVGMRTLG